MKPFRRLAAAFVLAAIHTALAASPVHSDAQATGELSWSTEAIPTGFSFRYRIFDPAETVLKDAAARRDENAGPIRATPTRPGVYRLRIDPDDKDTRPIERGAVFDAGRIETGRPRPADFDSFWQSQLDRLAGTPSNPAVKPGPSGKPGIIHEDIRMELPGNAGMQCQLARPQGDGKFPAIVIFQYAGVYPLPPGIVTNRAAQGWLALNVNAHDLPLGETASFYQKLADGSLRNYPLIGAESRETSYFLRMMLACSRAVDFLASHPSWDRRTLVACGNSQGGLQAIAAAALNPSVTAMVVNVPAGCDTAAPLAGRALSWPYWWKNTTAENRDAILHTASYFDAIHFAPRVKCRVLAGIGLIDQTARPDGILAMAARLAGPKEIVLMPDADHKGRNGTFAPFLRREKAWLEALKAGNPLPAAAASSGR